MVETLQQSHAGLESERAKARELLSSAKELERKSKAERENLEKERKKILENARKQARDITESARAESSRLLNELEDIKKQSKTENAAEMLRRAKAAAKRGLEKDRKGGPTGGKRLLRNISCQDPLKSATTCSLPTSTKMPWCCPFRQKRQLLCAGGHYKDQGVG